jgi:hypothetical protein
LHGVRRRGIFVFVSRFTVGICELIVNRRFGPLAPGATRDRVREALGEPDTVSAPDVVVEPMSIWVYGKSLCRGHLEFHFNADALWMIFADYLPLRRHRSQRFRFEPGCLGGLTLPSAAEVRAALRTDGAPEPRFEHIDPRWSDPPPPAEGPRIGTRIWNKAAGRARAREVKSASYGQLIWPGGTALGIGYHHATTPTGERLVSEDIVLVMTVPMEPTTEICKERLSAGGEAAAQGRGGEVGVVGSKTRRLMQITK